MCAACRDGILNQSLPQSEASEVAQAAAQAATDSQAECASCAWDGTHPQSSADGPGAGQPRAAGQEASGALSVDSAAQRGSGGRAACEAVLRNRKIQKVYLERKKVPLLASPLPSPCLHL